MQSDATKTELAAFCHRLGSPLGALVNHSYLLGLDRDGLPAGLQPALGGVERAVSDLRELLDTARAWLDAGERPLCRAPLRREALEAALPGRLVRGPAEPMVATDAEALGVLASHLASDCAVEDVRYDADGVTALWRPRAGVSVDWERGDGIFDVFGPAGCKPRWACARRLAQRLGGTLSVEAAGDGRQGVQLRLPATTENPA